MVKGIGKPSRLTYAQVESVGGIIWLFALSPWGIDVVNSVV